MIALVRRLTQPAGVPRLGLDTRRARLGRVREQNDFDGGSLFAAAFGSDHDDGSGRSGSKSWITEYILPFGTRPIAALSLPPTRQPTDCRSARGHPLPYLHSRRQ